MLHQNKRWVYIFDLSLERQPDNSPRFEMPEVAKKVETIFKNKEAYYITKDETVVTRISDVAIRKDDEVVDLLLQYADKNASNPIFAALDSGRLREEPKLSGEGIAVSAHLTISLKPTHPNGEQYVAILEEVPGLSRSHVKPFLTAIFKKAFENASFIDQDTNTKKKCRPRADLSSHPDQTLEEVLSGKQLKSVVLTGYKETGGLDEDTHLKPVDHSIKFKVVQQPQNRVSWLKNLRQKSIKKGFEDVRVFYRDPKRTSKQQQSVMLEKKQDAATALFTRQEEIQVSVNLKQCQDGLVPELCAKMRRVLQKTLDAIHEKKRRSN